MSAIRPWQPEQYDKFKAERSAPFFDLLAMVERKPAMRVIDLGSGTGELTAHLHRSLSAASTLGLDSSQAMHDQAAPRAGDGLAFELAELQSIKGRGPFDLIFSNAALHWIDDHEALLALLFAELAPGGQLAVQVPANHDHPSHTVAAAVAATPRFAAALSGHVRRSPVLRIEEYARLLHRLGCTRQQARMQVYPHLMPDSDGVVEWVKGTLLLDYQSRMTPTDFAEFVEAYRARLRQELADERPYLFAFKRILFAGTSA